MILHEKLAYDNSTLCHICNEELGKDRVHDYCHLSGKFRGASHKACNLKYRFHNLSGYDSHLFITTLENSKEDISCIPNNEKTTFLLRNRSSLTNLLIRKEKM